MTARSSTTLTTARGTWVYRETNRGIEGSDSMFSGGRGEVKGIL